MRDLSKHFWQVSWDVLDDDVMLEHILHPGIEKHVYFTYVVD